MYENASHVHPVLELCRVRVTTDHIMSFLRGLQEVYEDASHVHLVLELCRGGELVARAKERHYSERTVGWGSIDMNNVCLILMTSGVLEEGNYYTKRVLGCSGANIE